MKKYFVKLATLPVVVFCLLLTACGIGGKFAVTFYNNGEVYEVVELAKNTMLEEPSTPDAASEGYSFVGWSTVENSKDSVFSFGETEVLEDTNLYAVWEKTRAIVTVDPGNGDEVYTIKVGINKKLSDAALNTPELPNMKFSGWFTENGKLYNFDQTVTDDFKLIGKFEEKPDNKIGDTKWDFSMGIGKWIGASDRGTGRDLPTTEEESGVTIMYPANGWKGLMLENAEIPVIENGVLKVTYKTEVPVDDYRVYIQTEKGGSLTLNDLEDVKSYYATVAVAKANFGAWSESVGEDGWTTVTFDLSTLPYYKGASTIQGITFVPVARGEGTVSYKSVSIEAGTKWDLTQSIGQWEGGSDRAQVRGLPTSSDGNGTTITYPKSGWKGILLENQEITPGGKELIKVVYKTDLKVGNYRVYVLTDKGGSLTDNTLEDKDNYYVTISATDAAADKYVWSVTEGADGWTTVTFDMDKLVYYRDATVVYGLAFVPVASGEGSITYQSISIEDNPMEGVDPDAEPIVGAATETKWDMTKDIGIWFGASDRAQARDLPTVTDETGTTITYPESGWKGLLFESAAIAMEEKHMLNVVYKTDLAVSSYRVYVLTEKGGSLTSNTQGDKNSYYISLKSEEIAAGTTAMSISVGADGWTTVTFDLDSLEYYKDGTVIRGIAFVPVASGAGTISYKSVSIE